MAYDEFGRTPEQAERDRRATCVGCLAMLVLAIALAFAACSAL